MKRCARQPLLTSYDVAYLHQMVVHNVGKMICRQFVGTLVKHLVVDDVAFYDHLTAYHVVHMHLQSRLHLETHHILLPVGYATAAFLRCHCERVGHLHARMGVILEVCRLAAFLLQLLGSVESHIRHAFFEQHVDILPVDVPALALAVRTVFATEGHTFVELNSEPAERLYDIFLGSGNEPV